MKVALLSFDDASGGAAIACRRLGLALSQRSGVQVQMFVSHKFTSFDFVKETKGSFWVKKARFILEKLIFLPFAKSKDVRWSFSTASFGSDLAKELSTYDIIHLHWVNFGMLSIQGMADIFSLGKPIFWTLHDMWPLTGGCHHSGSCERFSGDCGHCTPFLRFPGESDLSNMILIKKKALWGAEKNLNIIGCSRWMAKRARKSSIFQNLKVRDIPNLYLSKEYYPLPKTEARTELGLDPKKKYILFVAMKTTIYWKGFSFLIQSLALLKEQLPKNERENVELLILGQMEHNTFDLGFEVHSFGRIADVKKINLIYNAATLFVSSSLQENLPNSILEAFACSIPVVAFGVGGIPEMIEHMENGYIADKENARDLASGLKWVLINENYESLAAKSLEKARRSYSQEKVIEQHLDFYTSAIGK